VRAEGMVTGHLRQTPLFTHSSPGPMKEFKLTKFYLKPGIKVIIRVAPPSVRSVH